jgi:hypothetical protein
MLTPLPAGAKPRVSSHLPGQGNPSLRIRMPWDTLYVVNQPVTGVTGTPTCDKHTQLVEVAPAKAVAIRIARIAG